MPKKDIKHFLIYRPFLAVFSQIPSAHIFHIFLMSRKHHQKNASNSCPGSNFTRRVSPPKFAICAFWRCCCVENDLIAIEWERAKQTSQPNFLSHPDERARRSLVEQRERVWVGGLAPKRIERGVWSNFNHVLRVCFQMVATSEADSSGSVGDTTGTTLSKLRQTLSSGLMTAQETGEWVRAKRPQIITLMNCDVQWLNRTKTTN